MSHGKTESAVDRLNRRLARLMGKKDPNSPIKTPSIPSNNKFTAIIFMMLLLLWGLTGIYYVPNESYGIILTNGKINKVVNGIDIGITFPFPFSDIINLDSSQNTLSLSSSSTESGILVSSEDGKLLDLNASLSFVISDPQKYYLNYYQENSDLNQKINWLMSAIVQDYFIHHSSQELMQSSTIITANEIRNLATMVLRNYGLQVNTFNIKSLQNISQVNASLPKNNKRVTPAEQIMLEATQYQTQKLAQTESMVSEFNKLLPQYQANKTAIVELMYYKMLSVVNSKIPTAESYPLLSLSESQFIQIESNSSGIYTQISKSSSNDNARVLDRSVNRQREFKDR
jgi:membrane protease subunit HflK